MGRPKRLPFSAPNSGGCLGDETTTRWRSPFGAPISTAGQTSYVASGGLGASVRECPLAEANKLKLVKNCPVARGPNQSVHPAATHAAAHSVGSSACSVRVPYFSSSPASVAWKWASISCRLAGASLPKALSTTLGHHLHHHLFNAFRTARALENEAADDRADDRRPADPNEQPHDRRPSLIIRGP